MHPFIRELIARGPLITDGAWGTQLQARGLAIGEFPDVWNIEHPEEVAAVARAYVDAGSEIILTNTFGANRIRLGESGAADHLRELNQQGVVLSREAAGDAARVFASMGPSGKMLLAGEITETELLTAFEEQAAILAEAGADALVVETMTDLDEARLAVTAAHATGLPVVACMVFDCGKDKDRTLMGVTPEQAVQTLVAAGADVVGANCGQGIGTFGSVCRRLSGVTGLPVWIKPNAGMPERIGARVEYRTSPAEFAAQALPLLEAGASFLGGCCGTTPEFIRGLAEIMPQRAGR